MYTFKESKEFLFGWLESNLQMLLVLQLVSLLCHLVFINTQINLFCLMIPIESLFPAMKNYLRINKILDLEENKLLLINLWSQETMKLINLNERENRLLFWFLTSKIRNYIFIAVNFSKQFNKVYFYDKNYL